MPATIKAIDFTKPFVIKLTKDKKVTKFSYNPQYATNTMRVVADDLSNYLYKRGVYLLRMIFSGTKTTSLYVPYDLSKNERLVESLLMTIDSARRYEQIDIKIKDVDDHELKLEVYNIEAVIEPTLVDDSESSDDSVQTEISPDECVMVYGIRRSF